MPCPDNGCADVFTVRIANANPSIVGSLPVQVATDFLTAEIVHHPPLGVLTGPCAQFWSINAV
jgi:hypothetical protein